MRKAPRSIIAPTFLVCFPVLAAIWGACGDDSSPANEAGAGGQAVGTGTGGAGAGPSASTGGAAGDGGSGGQAVCERGLICCTQPAVWSGGACVAEEECPALAGGEAATAPFGSPPADNSTTGCPAGLICFDGNDGPRCTSADLDNPTFPSCTEGECPAPLVCFGAVNECAEPCSLPTCPAEMTLYEIWHDGQIEQLCIPVCPAPPLGPDQSCVDHCGDASADGSCYCDSLCDGGDPLCCPDYFAACG